MEPIYEDIMNAMNHYITMDISAYEYYKRKTLNALIEDIKHSPKYMGIIKNVCAVNSHLYVTIKESVKTLPTETRTRLMDNVIHLLETNESLTWLCMEYTIN